jgi:hypothetical protein
MRFRKFGIPTHLDSSDFTNDDNHSDIANATTA